MGNGIQKFSPRLPLDRQLNAGNLNRIVRELDSLAIRNVVGGSFRKTPGGTEIVIGRSSGGGGQTSQPWDVIATKDASPATTYSVTVRPGTLNGILPSNWSDTFACAATGIYYAKAVITTDGTAVTAVTIECNTTAPTVQTPQVFGVETTIRYLFGLFSAGSVYRVIGAGHISLNPSVWMTKAKDSPAAPGELPWVQYYQLES
jgi:hypothetical protein